MYTLMTQHELEAMLDRTGMDFVDDIEKQNSMYNLPINEDPTLDDLQKPNGEHEKAYDRIRGFLKTMRDEIHEGVDIRTMLEIVEAAEAGDLQPVSEMGDFDLSEEKLVAFHTLASNDVAEAKKQVLVDIADWLADMTVYIRSEAMKFGIPLEAVQQVVMASNFSKLPSDGIPVHDENGKFLKDMTNFVPPENAIYTLLFDESLGDEVDLEDDAEDFEDEDDEDDEEFKD